MVREVKGIEKMSMLGAGGSLFYWLVSRFHVFKRRILGHVPRLTNKTTHHPTSHRPTEQP